MTPNRNKALWEKGDFTRIADTMRESGEALVQRLGITKGLKRAATEKVYRAFLDPEAMAKWP